MTQQTASSLTEIYRDRAAPYASFPQEHRSGGSMPMKLLRAEQTAFNEQQDPRADIVLVLVLKSNTTLRWDMGDGWTSERPIGRGDLQILPAFTTTTYDVTGANTLQLLSMPAKALGALLDEHLAGDLSAFDLLTDRFAFRDENVRRTVMQMWIESARSGGASDLLMDGLTQVLIARLLDKAGALRRPQIILPLSEVELTRLDEMIAARIAERLTVEDLAQTLDMPRWTFADAFKATTGDTPHAYVTGKRIERACELLRLGDMPLAEIAYATGFASQSHMTDTFRRVLGTTPGKWRAEVRG